uniref:SFRICE_015243 n=1 Tax=Spodoptera frugiperda TaxID=7108 RepID=A0A2H1V938_SPOFR
MDIPLNQYYDILQNINQQMRRRMISNRRHPWTFKTPEALQVLCRPFGESRIRQTLTLSMIRLLTAGGTSLAAMHRNAPICRRSTRHSGSELPT